MRMLNTSVRRYRYNFIGKITLRSFQSILLFQVLLALLFKNRRNCSFSIWYNITFFSMIHWISSINLPPNEDLDAFFRHISQILHSGIFPQICRDQTIESNNFKRTGIESSGFLSNSKDLLFPYLFACCIVGFLILFERIMKKDRIAMDCTWNFIIRINLLLYLEFITYGLINIYFFSEVNTCSIINLSLSVIFIILGFSWLIAHPIILNHYLCQSSSPEEFHSQESISTLTHEFKPLLQNSSHHYYTIFLIYRFLFSMSLVFLQNSPFTQVSLIFIFQIITSTYYVVVYIASTSPYQFKLDYFSVLASEFLLLLLIIFTAIRSLPALQGQAQEYIIMLSISILWLNELTILGRFILTIFSTPPVPLSPNHPDPVIQDIKNPQHTIQDLENSYSINNFTELNEKIIIVYEKHYCRNKEPNTKINLNEKSSSPKNSGLAPKRPAKLNLNKNFNPSPSSHGLVRKIELRPVKQVKLPIGAKTKQKNQALRNPEFFFSKRSTGNCLRPPIAEKANQDLGKSTKNIKDLN